MDAIRFSIWTITSRAPSPLASSTASGTAFAAYDAAPSAQRTRWTDAYTKGLNKAPFPHGLPKLPAGHYGPVAPMMSALDGLARSRGLDGALLTTRQFYKTNYTKPLLLLSGGSYFEDLASGQHLLGTQWGMMNETGSYPGQVWLWLYNFWYQIAPFNTSTNADAQIWVLMMGLSLASCASRSSPVFVASRATSASTS